MTTEKLTRQLVNVLDESKALDIQVLDVRNLTSIADTMIIASGNSDRQVRALADKVIEAAKKSGHIPLGTEGQQQGDWILVDLGDIILHIMRPATRIYYQLEKLWSGNDQQASVSSQ